MILVLSDRADPHVRLVLPLLEARNADVLWFDPKDFPSAVAIELELGDRGFFARHLVMEGRRVDLASVSAIWLRRPNAPQAGPGVADADARVWVAETAQEVMSGVYELLDCRWVPARPRAVQAARSKVWQLQVAAQLGFDVPPTCITNDPAELLAFYARRDGRLVTKLAAHARPRFGGQDLQAPTTVVHRRDMLDAESVRHAPALLQAYVDKKLELRVTVVGDRVFCAAIDSQASRVTRDDWRNYDDDRTAYSAHPLPTEVEARCLQLVRHFGLTFGAIDMVLTPRGDHVFLELNPNGQWGWVAERARLPIAEALAELLLSGRAKPEESRAGAL